MSKQMSTVKPLDDMVIESVASDGEVVIRWPGGFCLRIRSSPELGVYYRRLIGQTNDCDQDAVAPQ